MALGGPCRRRGMAAASVAVGVVLLLTPTVAWGFDRATSPPSLRLDMARPVAAPGSIPIPGCSGPNGNFSVKFLPAGPGASSIDASTGDYDGAAPLNFSANLSITGFPALYTYTVNWGDGSQDTVGSLNKTTAAPSNLSFSHQFTLPALVQPNVFVSYSCQDGTSGGAGTDWLLDVYGPAGPDPVQVTANVTNGTVPLEVNYTATIAGAPSNATASWTYFVPDGPTLQQSTSALHLTQSWFNAHLRAPGLPGGDVQILYPGTSLLYAEAGLPQVDVLALAMVNVSHTPLSGYPPWNVTFWANATNLTGGPAPANTSVHWVFQDPQGTGLFAEGPTNGATVWREYWLNDTGIQTVAGATAEVLRSDGVVLGYQSVYLPMAAPVATLALKASPASGTAPFAFVLTAQLLSAPPVPNGSTPFELDLVAAEPGAASAWNDTETNWGGGNLSVPALLRSPGSYLVKAGAYRTGVASRTLLASALINISVTAPPVPSLSLPSASRLWVDVGQPVTISTSVRGPSGTDSIVWAGLPASCPSTNATTIVCIPSAPGLLSVTAQLIYAPNASVVSSAVSVRVSPDPTVSVPIASSPPVLVGDNVSFSVTLTPGSGGDLVGWHGLPTGCSATNASSTLVFCRLTAGNFSVSASVEDSNAFVANGPALNFTVRTLTSSPMPPPPAAQASSPVDWWPTLGLLVGLAAIMAVGAILLNRRRRPRRALSPKPPAG